MPPQDIKPYGSFEQWSDLIRSALVWVDAADPCSGRIDIEVENDERYSNMVTLFEAWEKCYPVSVRVTLKSVLADIKAALDEEKNHSLRKFLDLGDALLPFDRKASRVTDLDALRLSRSLRPGKTGTRIIAGRRLIQSNSEGSSSTKAWGLADA
jgi:hypothetical protein